MKKLIAAWLCSTALLVAACVETPPPTAGAGTGEGETCQPGNTPCR